MPGTVFYIYIHNIALKFEEVQSYLVLLYLVMMSYLLCFLYLQVIPFLRGNAWEQPPPDLASYLYKNRIVYLGMSLVPSVTELMLAEFLYLQYEDEEKPIYLYINSTGTTKVNIFSSCSM